MLRKLSWASTFLQKHQVARIMKTNIYLLNLLPFAHFTCLQNYCHSILRTLFSKYNRMRNISRTMVCFPLTFPSKCLPAREIFSFGSLPCENRQEQNVTKCNKWLYILLHTLVCCQTSNQRNQHLTLFFPLAYRSQDVLQLQLRLKVREEEYDSTHLSCVPSKWCILNLNYCMDIIRNTKLSTASPSESHSKWEVSINNRRFEDTKASLFFLGNSSHCKR